MPTWVRLTLGVIGLALLRGAYMVAQPLLHGDWSWSHSLSAAVLATIGIDGFFAAIRKRWPLVMFCDLLFARLVSGRWP